MPEAVPTVLIVEDDSPIAEALALIMEDMGFTAVVTFNGRDGLAAATRQSFHLIVTDLMMPHMNGEAMIAVLRERGEPLPPILALTARDYVRAQDIGATEVLAKPFDLGKFQKVVCRLLDVEPIA